MGKPRLIILVRHAQSEGNKNRDIHQFIPDHRVKLTPDGQVQAEEAGRRLRSMLRPDDTIQFFTSPYRRTRETTEGILKTLTCDDPDPSPFPRNKIKVYEEPRLREQDFGNFQPCSDEMERMWQERADYGHFFYRIPNGESAADAYDRIAGFNESLWRQFGDDDFPSVCVLVTHGLMTRVFLMKWYHWSVEYFEDLRNVNHCEFITMKQSRDSGKYVLENQLRTWSELKKRAGNASSASMTSVALASSTSQTSIRRWGGCANGCNHDKINYPRKVRRKDTAEFLQAAAPHGHREASEHGTEHTHHEHGGVKAPIATDLSTTEVESPLNTGSTASDHADESASSTSDFEGAGRYRVPGRNTALPIRLHPGRDGGGSQSGAATPAEGGFSDDSDFFPNPRKAAINRESRSILAEAIGNKSNSRARSRSSGSRTKTSERRNSRKQSNITKTEAEWAAESGMGSGAFADALGDGDVEDGAGSKKEKNGTIEEVHEDEETNAGVADKVEAAKMEDRKTYSEVY